MPEKRRLITVKKTQIPNKELLNPSLDILFLKTTSDKNNNIKKNNPNMVIYEPSRPKKESSLMKKIPQACRGNYINNTHRMAATCGSPWQTLKHSLESHEEGAPRPVGQMTVFVPPEDYKSIQAELVRGVPQARVPENFFLGELPQ